MYPQSKDKIIVTHCYHCQNKAAFSIHGELDYKIEPSEEEFARINEWIDFEDDDQIDDDDAYEQDYFLKHIYPQLLHEEYIKTVYYHQKKIFLLKCVICSKPSVLSLGKNIAPDSTTFTPFEKRYDPFSGTNDTSKSHNIDSFLIEGYSADILYPMKRLGPKPSAKMPEKVAQIFEEAKTVYNGSPRASAALLRLALQTLLIDLGLPAEKNINEAIKRLVRDNFIQENQQALDIIRVLGNNSVHPGEIDINEDAQTVLQLFDLMNFIVNQLVQEQDTIKEKIQGMYSKLPENERDKIKKRDNKI